MQRKRFPIALKRADVNETPGSKEALLPFREQRKEKFRKGLSIWPTIGFQFSLKLNPIN